MLKMLNADSNTLERRNYLVKEKSVAGSSANNEKSAKSEHISPAGLPNFFIDTILNAQPVSKASGGFVSDHSNYKHCTQNFANVRTEDGSSNSVQSNLYYTDEDFCEQTLTQRLWKPNEKHSNFFSKLQSRMYDMITNEKGDNFYASPNMLESNEDNNINFLKWHNFTFHQWQHFVQSSLACNLLHNQKEERYNNDVTPSFKQPIENLSRLLPTPYWNESGVGTSPPWNPNDTGCLNNDKKLRKCCSYPHYVFNSHSCEVISQSRDTSPLTKLNKMSQKIVVTRTKTVRRKRKPTHSPIMHFSLSNEVSKTDNDLQKQTKSTSECKPVSSQSDNLLPEKTWPAWVYCTRYSDRPSAGPRLRKIKDKLAKKNQQYEKRARTAFSTAQLEQLQKEFQESQYLTEERRVRLAENLGLSVAQIKVWFQNKRAKVKKTSGVRNTLAMQLIAQGLYNHCTQAVRENES